MDPVWSLECFRPGLLSDGTCQLRAAFEKTAGVDDMAVVARRGEPSPFTRVLDRALLFIAETRPALSATPERSAESSRRHAEAKAAVERLYGELEIAAP